MTVNNVSLLIALFLLLALMLFVFYTTKNRVKQIRKH